MLARRVVVAIASSALVLAACGGGDRDDGLASVQADAGPATSTARAPGSPTARAPADPALEFLADDLRGGQVDGRSLAGQDLVLWFWAPW